MNLLRRHAARGALAAQRWVGRVSLQRRITMFTAIIVIAMFLAFAFLGWIAVSRSVDATLAERRATAVVIARDAAMYLQNAQSALDGARAEVEQDPLVSDSAHASALLGHLLGHVRTYFVSLTLFDDGERVLGSVGLTEPVALTAPARDLLERTRARRSAQVSGRLRLPGFANAGVLFATPVALADGRVATLAGSLPLPSPTLASLIGDLGLGRTGHAELVDDRFVVLASTDPLASGTVSQHADFYGPLLAAGTSAVGRAADPTHDPGRDVHMVAYAPVPGSGWGVGIGQSEAEAFGTALQLRDQSLAASAIALAIALAFAWLEKRSVILPLAALTRAGRRMATGDLTRPISVAQTDEIGELAEVLEHMRQQLQESMTRTATWNRQLERRVHARTQELEIRNRHLRAICDVSTLANATSEPEEVVRVALDKLVSVLGARQGWAFAYEDERDCLRLTAVCPDEAESVAPVADGSLEAFCRRSLGRVELASELLELGPAPSTAGGERPLVRCYAAPIVASDEPWGVLCVVTPPSRTLGRAGRMLVRSIAYQVALSLQNARLADVRARLEAARQLDVLQAEFVASVSHELRTPLGFIKGYTTTLLRQNVTWEPAQQHEFLEIVDEEADNLTELVDQLLDVARSHAGRLRLEKTLVDVASVARTAADRIGNSAGDDRVRIAIEPVPPVLADPARLEQVVLNLLQNAAKYSPPDAAIDLSVAEDADGLRISVLDRGPGIPESEIDRIFDPFYRTLSAAEGRVRGSGLGLAVCRAIVDAHGGRIWAESRPGGGTVAHVTLPLDQQPGMEHTDGAEAHPRG